MWNDWWGLLAQSVDVRTWDLSSLGSSLNLGSRFCPLARHFIRIAQQLKSAMLGLCGAELKAEHHAYSINIVCT